MSLQFYRQLRERHGPPITALTRRDVLKAAIAASAGFLLTRDGPISMTWESTSTQPGDQDVCMIGFSGAGSADICRGWPVGERQENYKKLLEQWFPGFGGALVKSQLMDWPSDRWTKASYSFPAPGQVTSQGPTLFEGLGRLHFAGEHTCYAFPGYMEGALQSGARLAQRLAERDGVLKPQSQQGTGSK